MMGERLVPEKDVIQLKKERQMWQKRYMKSQEEVIRTKAEIEQLIKSVENKELQLKRAISQKGINKTAETLKASLRAHNMKLQEEVKRLTETLAESQRQLGTVRHSRRQKKAEPTPPLETKQAPVVAAPLISLRSKAASQFLGATTTPSRQGSGSPMPLSPRKSQEERVLVTARTLLSPAKSPRGSVELPPPLEKRKDSDVISVKSRTLRSPSRAPPTAPSSHLILTPREQRSGLSSNSESLRSDVSPLGPPRRGIGTTVKASEYQSPLAREVSALERIYEAEGREHHSGSALSAVPIAVFTQTPPASQPAIHEVPPLQIPFTPLLQPTRPDTAVTPKSSPPSQGEFVAQVGEESYSAGGSDGNRKRWC